MPDSLDLSMERQLILLYGVPGHGKSRSVAHLLDWARDEDHHVAILDADRGITRAIKEVMDEIPENLDYFRATNWSKMKEARDYILNTLGPGDWLIIENAKRIWQLAKRDYIEKTYGVDEDEFMQQKRIDAEERAQEELRKPANVNKTVEEQALIARQAKNRILQYEGLDGRTDWPRITTKYFAIIGQLFDDGEFNILTTSTAAKLDSQTAEDYPEYVTIGMRPDGQKDLVAMHSTIAYCYQNEGEYYWRTDLGNATKDRGHERKRDVPCTDLGFWTTYTDLFPEELEAAKGGE